VNQWFKRSMCALLAAGVVTCGSPAYASKHAQSAPHDGMRGLGLIQGKTLTVSINPDGPTP
jgi:hypothetical protein